MIDLPRQLPFVWHQIPPNGGRRVVKTGGVATVAPMVSVIIPSFNTPEAVLKETIESLREQSFWNWEAVIVDDGSEEIEGLKAVEALAKDDSRFRIVTHGENRGLSAARNTGAREAKGRLLVFLDSDDLLDPNAIEKWTWFLLTHPDYSAVNSWLVGFGYEQFLYVEGFYRRHYFLKHNRCSAIAMIRREAFLGVGGNDESIREGSEDWDFWVRMANSGRWGHTIREPLTWYRTRANHNDRWENYGEKSDIRFRRRFPVICPELWERGFPLVEGPDSGVDIAESDAEALTLRQKKKKKRVLILSESWRSEDGSMTSIEKWIGLFQDEMGWEVSLVECFATEGGEGENLRRWVTDRYTLESFLPLEAWVSFLSSLIVSQGHDLVLLVDAGPIYSLLGPLRKKCPSTVIADVIHEEGREESRRALLEFSLENDLYLDQHIALSSKTAALWEAEAAMRDRVARIPFWLLPVPEAESEGEGEGEREEGEDRLSKIATTATVIALPPARAESFPWDVAAAVGRSLSSAGVHDFVFVVPLLLGDSRKGQETVMECFQIYDIPEEQFLILSLPDEIRAWERFHDRLDILLAIPHDSVVGALEVHACEALSMGAAIVATSPCEEFAAIRDSKSLIETSGATEASEAISALIQNPAELDGLKAGGRSFVQSGFPSLESIQRLLTEMILKGRSESDDEDLGETGNINLVRRWLWESRYRSKYRVVREHEGELVERLERAESKLENFRGMIERRDRKISGLESKLADFGKAKKNGGRKSKTKKKGFLRRWMTPEGKNEIRARVKGGFCRSVLRKSQDRFGITTTYLHRKEVHPFDDRNFKDEYQDGVYLALYEFAKRHSLRSVLDIGCGSGFKLMKYFSDFRTLGTDRDPTLVYLKETYPERAWGVSNFEDLPGEDFDFVISVDVIEHLLNPDELMHFLSRLDCQYVALATPDRSALGDRARFGPPINRHHVREWTREEFVSYVSRWFEVIESDVVDGHEHYLIARPLRTSSSRP